MGTIDFSEERLQKQIDFIVEMDKLKHIYRQSYLADGSRKENDAEHSWHLALMVFLLAEHTLEQEVDLLHTMKMVIIHDLVEIDAGDTYCYDEKAALDKEERERKAAERIFNLLPADQAQELRELWEEFEELATPEARYAAALDRLQPLLLNYASQGKSWQEHEVTRSYTLKRNNHIEDSSAVLWAYALRLLDEAVKKGYLAD
ncbi:MAG: HD domain-containing protein [Clostridia bacterium]|nr:HD domain-containing protein [Clostridia bacterium]